MADNRIYTVIRNPETFDGNALNDDYVSDQVEKKRYYLVKSNMYKHIDLGPNSELMEMLGVNRKDDQDEIMLWDEWKELVNCYAFYDLILQNKKNLIPLIYL